MRDYNVYFTADLHLFHKNVIDMEYRPFNSIEHMHKEIVYRWNEVVTGKDTVYLLGDVSFGKVDETIEVLDQLNGKIHLILGNHDNSNFKSKYKLELLSDRFESVSNMKEIKVRDNETGLNQKITLCHYAMRVWNCSHYGAYQLYGHSHGSLPDDPNSLSMDVGVDCHNFYPITYEQVKEVMSRKVFKPIDHHR